MGFLHSSVHPQPNVLALSLFIDTPEKGGMRSLRRDVSCMDVSRFNAFDYATVISGISY